MSVKRDLIPFSAGLLVHRVSRAKRTPLVFGWAGILAAVAGCSQDNRDAAAAVVRDSAGIRIVESRASAWTALQPWRVAEEPVLRIGVLEGDSAYQFHQIRGIDLLPDGGLVVLDGGSLQLRRYDAGGRHMWSFGARGRGPGQFEQPSYIARDSGSFFLWDRALARLTVIAASGDLLRTEPHIPASGDPPIAHGRFVDGALLATFPNAISPPTPGTVLADTISLWRFDRGTEQRRLLARLPGPVWLWTGRYQLPVPFTANPLRVIAGLRLITASGEYPEILIHESNGDLAAKFVLPREPAAVSAADVRRVIDYWIEHRFYGAPADVWEEWLERMPVPQQQPAFDRLFVDGNGNLWARQYRIEADTTAPSNWDVINADGEYLGVVTTPRRVEVMAFGDRALAGVTRDTLDVEYIHVYAIAVGRQ